MSGIRLGALKGIAQRFTPRPSDAVGIDVGHSNVKVVRVRRTDKGLALEGMELLPAVALPRRVDESVQTPPALRLPRAVQGRHGALAVSGGCAVVKLLSFPGQGDSDGAGLDDKILTGMALEEPSRYRIGYKLITESSARSETRVLVVAVPDVEARAACMLLPSGFPVPHSVEIAGIAAMTAFLHGAGKNTEDAVGMLEFGESVSYFAIFRRGTPILVRKFDVGSARITERVQESLGIDQATAQGILADGSFDISHQIGEVLDAFLKQLLVTRDFVERRENCRVTRVFASGGITRAKSWLSEVRAALGYDITPWNPFDALHVEPGRFPERFTGQELRFAAAVGASLATLSEETA